MKKKRRKMIHWELCKNLKFHYTDKYYIHKSESVLENETYKILWDYLIQMNRPYLARKPNLIVMAIELVCILVFPRGLYLSYIHFPFISFHYFVPFHFIAENTLPE